MFTVFITRKYPPAVGGMEKMHFELSKALAETTPTKIIAYGGSQKKLPIVLPILLIKTILFICQQKQSNIILGDALLSVFIPVLRLFSRQKIMVITHGLDVTFDRFFYQQLVTPNLKKADVIVSISQATKEELVKRGVSKSKIKVIPVGINIDEYQKKMDLNVAGKRLSERINSNLTGKKILLTIGRLVERKGHAWFIDQVMPLLDESFIYLIVGDGEQRKNIEELIISKNLQKRVFLLGKVDDEYKIKLLRLANVFIMPNIEVKNDPEGFGIVALEAAAAGLPTVATDIQGIRDAVKDGESGFLVGSMDKDLFVSFIKNADKNKSLKIVDHAKKFRWNTLAKQYLNSFI